MKLRSNQIKEHFSKGNALPLYILSGDEALLLQECADQLRSEFRKQGFSERERFNVDAGFDWNALLQAGNSMSLFGDRKILEVRHDKPKFDDKAKKALVEYAENPNPDNVLLLIIPKMDKKSQNTKWFQKLETAGAMIQVWPIELNQFPQWVHQRMRGANLEPSRDAVQLLAQRVEGNLLAAAQEVDKLVLLMGEGPVEVSDIENAVADHARYSLYELVDEALKGNCSQATKMLNHLRAGGSEPSVILWAFSNEIRKLAGMSQLINNGMAPARVMQEYRIWDTKKSIIQSALQRIPANGFKHCLLEAARIDRTIKGIGHGNPWDGFNNLILWLSGSIQPGKMALDS
ncbi:DNA polymerase III subunit delta [Ketobacter sp. MCCC 1A13808]|uniref:DNA polymerase III subunit delta n=1 Tax=Ketobacter sp. MCCC 1A13808 TaxID=2602738 RepID=UPI000F13122F|nr:DNA polymerase III subunit delta [Ketobacter sp. MCCC 1A13808]MVF12980.1 DNA polymerase III subunit delta [Ketobacter sp. MCCC 1A13808]RLP53826.1 MAG: DNA polymerase III subunit delta [Ketobacter sp.]